MEQVRFYFLEKKSSVIELVAEMKDEVKMLDSYAGNTSFGLLASLGLFVSFKTITMIH